MRVGHGYDIHPLQEGVGPLLLGGHVVAGDLKTTGHSDADVLLHAVADAVLGAAGLGDLGLHFPASDETLRGVESRQLLLRSIALARDAGCQLYNVDSTLIAARPLLAAEREAIAGSLAACCGLDPRRVNVKLKSNEGFDAAGRGEAIAAHAVVLMLEESDE